MSRYIRLLSVFTILLFLACGVTAAAASTVTGMKAPDYSGDFRLIPDTDNFKSPDPSFYVWETGGILGSVVGILSNMLMMSGVAILKLSILVMDLGMHPSWLNSTIDAVSEAAQSKGWEFVDSLWPFIVLGAFFMVGKDYMQGSYAVMLRRLMVFALSLTVLSAAFGMSSSTVSKSLTASLDFSDWLSTKFMQVFSGQGSNGKDSNIYTSVWEQMADRPLEAGEFGELNIKITAEDAVKINKAIEPYQVVAGMKWVDALLWFAPDTDERADIIDIYADNYEAKYESAKNPYSRLMISVISLLSSVLSALFLLMIGGIMIAMVMYFIALIMSGIIILPASLIPTKEPVLVMKYLTKILGVFMAIAFIFLYTALVLIIANLFTAMESLEFLFRQLLVMITFVAGLIMFFVLLGKLQSAPGFKHMNDVLKPVSNAGQYMKRRYGRRRNANRISDYIDDELEDGFDDLNGGNEKRKSNARASRRTDRAEATPEIRMEVKEDGTTTLSVIEQPKPNNSDRTTKAKNNSSLDKTAPPARTKENVSSAVTPVDKPEEKSGSDIGSETQSTTAENVVADKATSQQQNASEKKDNEQNSDKVSDKHNTVAGQEELERGEKEVAVSTEEANLQMASNQVRNAQQQNNQVNSNSNELRDDRTESLNRNNSTLDKSEDVINTPGSKESSKPAAISHSVSQGQEKADTSTSQSDSNPTVTKKDIDQIIRQTTANDSSLRDRSDVSEARIDDSFTKTGESVVQELSSTRGNLSADRTKADSSSPQEHSESQGQDATVPKNDVITQVTPSKPDPSDVTATIADLNRLKAATADKDQNMLDIIEDSERHMIDKMKETNEKLNQEIQGNNKNIQEVLSSWPESPRDNQSKGDNAIVVPSKVEKGSEPKESARTSKKNPGSDDVGNSNPAKDGAKINTSRPSKTDVSDWGE